MIRVDPLRREIVGEMHLRPSPAVDAPARILQVLSLLDGDSLAQAIEHARHLGIDLADGQARHGSVERDGIIFLWERHSEAVTLTAVVANQVNDNVASIAEDAIADVLGRLLRAIKIDLVNDHEEAIERAKALDLTRTGTVSGIVGTARFWSNFTLDENDGFGRLLIYAGEEDRNDLGRVIRQLQELGNYRNLALLGLPLVRQHAETLAELERGIGHLIGSLSSTGGDRIVLATLVEAAAKAARMRSDTAFRLGATRAYGRIVAERLESLDAEPVDGFQTLAQFNNRRLLPALRTCENFAERLDQLAEHIAYTSNLLRTRIETELHWQNGQLLQSLGETGRAQLRLQRLVEGLSVFAVGYYAIGLLDHLLRILPEGWSHVGERMSSYLVIPVILLIAIYLRFQRSRHDLLDPYRRAHLPWKSDNV